jgi:hypothetical protein
MNQLTSIPRLHASNPAHRNYNVFIIHDSRILEERGPVIQTFPGPRMKKKIFTKECSLGLRPNFANTNNCREACNKNVGCVFPRK